MSASSLIVKVRFLGECRTVLKVTGWKILFNSTWGRFQTQFDAILKSLEKHADLVDREANAVNIVQAKAWRDTYMEDSKAWKDKYFEDSKQKAKERAANELAAVLSWLDPTLKNANQEQELYRLSTSRHAGTCDWLLENAKIKKWMAAGSSNSVLWLQGPPGAGMVFPSCRLYPRRCMAKGHPMPSSYGGLRKL